MNGTTKKIENIKLLLDIANTIINDYGQLQLAGLINNVASDLVQEIEEDNLINK